MRVVPYAAPVPAIAYSETGGQYRTSSESGWRETPSTGKTSCQYRTSRRARVADRGGATRVALSKELWSRKLVAAYDMSVPDIA
eukprot:337051-Rhodomonas_salina.1